MGGERQRRYVERQMALDPEGFKSRRVSTARRWVLSNPEKTRAHGAVRRAVKRGDLVRPDHCSSCNKECRPEASHDDYAEPLVVEWLCRQCHARKDALVRSVSSD